MTSKTILLTGGSGHVGYAVLLEALSKGYKVRAAVRSDAKADMIKSIKTTQPYLSQLEFVVVKDITVDGAFDEAVKNVAAIVHVASPIPSKNVADFEKDLIQPAIRGTTGILYSALKEASIETVVITSSLAAVLGAEGLLTADSVSPQPTGPYEEMFPAYAASKNLAHKSVNRFIEEEKPTFNIINVLPSYIIGRNELANTLDEISGGSNNAILAPILGKKSEPTLLGVAHLQDVAFIHIAALALKENINLGANYDYASSFQWNDSMELAKKYFPEAVESGLLPLGGDQPSEACPFDASETEKMLNFKFKTPDEMVKDIVGQYVEAAI